MASKYAAVVERLPKMDAQEPSYQEKVEAVKRDLAPMLSSSSEIANEYVLLRGEEDNLEEQLSVLRLRKAAVEQLLVDRFEHDDVSSIKLTSGHSVSVQVEPYAQVVDKDALREWAKTNGLERSLTLPWQTVNALAKERLLAGDAEPEGTKVFARTKLVLRKG